MESATPARLSTGVGHLTFVAVGICCGLELFRIVQLFTYTLFDLLPMKNVFVHCHSFSCHLRLVLQASAGQRLLAKQQAAAAAGGQQDGHESDMYRREAYPNNWQARQAGAR